MQYTNMREKRHIWNTCMRLFTENALLLIRSHGVNHYVVYV